jgi:transcriptional regulator with XRE-family HTH domain
MVTDMSIASVPTANALLVAPSRLLRLYLEEAAATMAMRREVLGGRIREARLAKGWKQKRLAAAVHVEPQTVSNWERGMTTPDLDVLELVAEALDVEVAWLLRDPVSQAAEEASIARVLETVGTLLEEVRELRSGQDEIGERLGRIEATGPVRAGSTATP